MPEPATFSELEWHFLTPSEKRALRIFSSVSLGFDPLSRAPGVGQKSMDALIAKGLAVEGEPSLDGRTFKITDKGWLAVEWLHGRRPTVYPD